MDKHLTESLELLTKILEETDPNVLLADFEKFSENAVGPSVDEYFEVLNNAS